MAAAIEHLWGRGALDALRGRLDLPAEHVLFDQIASPLSWYPENLAARIGAIVWDDLAARDEAALQRFAEQTIDHGWGRMHSVLVRLATPRILARRAPELWRRDHSHGDVEVVVVDPTTLRLRLSDHPCRYILSLTRVRDLETVEAPDPAGALVMTATWR
jgi:hypothetical protein